MADPQEDFVSFEEIKQLVSRYMNHPFLRKHGIVQPISRFHFEAMRAIMQTAKVATSEMRLVISAVLMLHQGLTIHDDVDERMGLMRQLTVLAGDLDSSLYYWVLAQLGNSALLSALSQAVVIMNEAKMALCHPDDGMSADSFWRSHEAVQGALILAVAAHYLSPEDHHLEYMRRLVRAHVLQRFVASDRLPNQIPRPQVVARMQEVVRDLAEKSVSALREPFGVFIAEYMESMQHSVARLSFAEGLR